MFTRFRDSIVYPKRILQFRKDSFLLVFSYLFLFGLLMSLGVLVFVIKFDGFNGDFYNTVEKSLINPTVDCEIKNSLLLCDEDSSQMIFQNSFFAIYVAQTEDGSVKDLNPTYVNFIFQEDHIVITSFGFRTTKLISELPSEFQNLDFSIINTDKEAFSKELVDGLGQYLIQTKSTWGILLTGSEVLSNFVFVILITLINSWVINMRFKIIPFKELFKMSAYLGTSLYLLLTFNGLINLGYLLIFIFIVVSIRQTNSLTMEIMRVIKKK